MSTDHVDSEVAEQIKNVNPNSDLLKKTEEFESDLEFNQEPEPVKKEIEPAKEQPKPIMMNKDGSLQLKDNTEAFRWAAAAIQGGFVPKSYTKPMQVLAAFQTGAELGLKPMASLTSLAVINGTPSLHTDGPMGLVLASGKLKKFEAYYFDKDGEKITGPQAKLGNKLFGAYFSAERVGVEGSFEFSYTLDEAEQANLYKKPTNRDAERKRKRKPWDLYSDIMLARRCRAFVLKTLFADILKGVKIAEYDFDAMPEKDSYPNLKDVTSGNAASEMKDAI